MTYDHETGDGWSVRSITIRLWRWNVTFVLDVSGR
jgi:hypothetical protein